MVAAQVQQVLNPETKGHLGIRVVPTHHQVQAAKGVDESTAAESALIESPSPPSPEVLFGGGLIRSAGGDRP
jgi:hypothetical protein